MGSSSSSLKALLISTAILSIATAVKLSIPSLLTFAVDDIPAIYSPIISFLKPPYLYFVINGIIITIAAISWFQSQQLVNAPELSSELPPVSILEPPVAVYEMEITPVVDVETVAESRLEEVGIEDEDGSTWEPSERVVESPPLPEKFIFPVKEKQLVTSRFPRKPTKPTHEGERALRVLKPKKHETLESTWKAITDGRHPPLTRHLRKSDTLESHLDRRDSSGESAAEMKKSETFRDRKSYVDENHWSPASGGRLRKDGSLSQDELNRRVEAFIKKFNDEMRLQRQESLNQYMGMINGGAH